MKKALVAYYSFSGTTRALAEEIARQVGADILQLVPQRHYAFNHNTAAKTVRREIATGHCPKLQGTGAPLDAYSTIFVGTPNWFKTLAPPVLSFLRLHSFSGKTVVPFCTHGGGGFGLIETRIAEECPGANLLPGLSLSGTEAAVVTNWLQTLGAPIAP